MSVVKHDYLPRAVAAHPRFELLVVADDGDQPNWVHERNQRFADEFGIPYVPDVPKAKTEHDFDLVGVSSEAERHCNLAVRAANAGLHVIADKPMSTRLSECARACRSRATQQHQISPLESQLPPGSHPGQRGVQSGAIGELTPSTLTFIFQKSRSAQGPRQPGDPPINWLERQIEAHADGSDGGIGIEAMGELQIEGIYPLGYIRMLTGVDVRRVFARTATHFHQANVDNHVDDLALFRWNLTTASSARFALGASARRAIRTSAKSRFTPSARKEGLSSPRLGRNLASITVTSRRGVQKQTYSQ
ncbi:MAG: hypothetical protein Ct9H300mP7_2120 [Verrucomicrobiota bacterium]|nr:MAG: hypothetical protein Ct9H300mP7_2120 [Verrucomicrobiota bacterium]